MENNVGIKTLKIRCKKPYGAIICPGATEYLGLAAGKAKKAVVVSDETVFRLYGKKAKEILKGVGVETFSFIFPVGEKRKTKNVLDKLLILLTELDLCKGDCLIALGGGVVSDITGLGAALFKRGLDYINVPTSLAAMSNACIGGKTGVDFLGKKDLIGVVNQPKIVLCDTDFLKTLPEDNIKDGMAEIIRSAVACDRYFFSRLEEEELTVEEMILCALKIKARLIKKDEDFTGAQRVLTLGDSFKTAVESIAGNGLLYHKALSFGVLSAVTLAENLGMAKGMKQRIRAVFEKYGLDYNVGVNNLLVYDKLFGEDREDDETLSAVLPERMGVAGIKRFSARYIKEALYGR